MAEEMEEDESSGYDLLEKTRISMEDLVAKMLVIKKEGGKPKKELREVVTQMTLHFINLRQVNRSILLEEDRIKQETESAKAPVDYATLQLQNYMYEKNHYVKAIKACKDFKSKHPDITLVAEEDFLKSAPEHIKGDLLNADTHDLMLKRLDFELFQRKELCKQREGLEQRKKELQDIIAQRKKFLTSLPSHLKSLKKASLPVQQQLGILHTKKIKQHQFAGLLPPPLYVIYSQFLAQKEAFVDYIDLEIVGSLKDAQAFAREQANREIRNSEGGVDSRLEDEQPEEEEDGQRRRKRPKKLQTNSNPDGAGVYASHPLNVLLHVSNDEVSDANLTKLITLRFEYSPKLNVVFVGVEGSKEGPECNILCNLFPDDTGLELPHQAARLLVSEVSVLDGRTSRPYKWAQHLAGIDFLPEVSPLLTDAITSSVDLSKNLVVLSGLSVYRQQHRVQTVLERIRARKKAQLALTEQLDLLQKLRLPPLTERNVPWAAHNPKCHLDSWVLVGAAPSQDLTVAIDHDNDVSEPMSLDADASTAALKDETENAREDGELPAVAQPSALHTDKKPSPSRISISENQRDFTSMTKVLTPAPSKKFTTALISPRITDMDDLSELMYNSDSGEEQPVNDEQGINMADNDPKLKSSWIEYGTREYNLVLSRKAGNDENEIEMEAKVKISMEYPIRPPFFSLKLFMGSSDARADSMSHDDFDWHNELRSFEAEVNLHILQMVREEDEDHILAHQITFLIMLFDFLIDQSVSLPNARKGTSVIDVGLCRPVGGVILSRLYRGRDRRKMISWKRDGCVAGYPS